MIAPSIDPFSAKNYEMPADEAARVLRYVGLLSGEDDPAARPFVRATARRAGSTATPTSSRPGRRRRATCRFVARLSRWDRLKDMAGVMAGFAEHVGGTRDAHLVLAGPSVTGVADDPESAQVLDECTVLWRSLPHAQRSRIHLACTPMRDPDEAAAIVNALQRHARRSCRRAWPRASA